MKIKNRFLAVIIGLSLSAPAFALLTPTDQTRCERYAGKTGCSAARESVRPHVAVVGAHSAEAVAAYNNRVQYQNNTGNQRQPIVNLSKTNPIANQQTTNE